MIADTQYALRVEKELADGNAIIPAVFDFGPAPSDVDLAKSFSEELLRLRGEGGAPPFKHFAALIYAFSQPGFPQFRITFSNRGPKS